MNIAKPISCIHNETRVIKRERVSRENGILTKQELVLSICHFPLPSLSGFQCQVKAKQQKCPHGGPYSPN